MLFLLTSLYVLQRTLAVPIPGAISDDPAPSTCTGTSCRSLLSIVWSCIVTIFACTWVAVHPNVPTPEQSAHQRWYSRPLRRARIMLYALIGPEFVLIWAWRQRIVASRKSETLRDWSRVHGFLAVMGGFVDGKEVLSAKEIEDLVQNGEIEYPIISREEIEDKSKGDAVTKALVVSQTGWFLLQCVARAHQHLAVTELELATAAFAVLNIIMYMVWWDKPLDVQCPIKVRRRSSGNDEASEEQDRVRDSAGEWNWQSCFRGWSWDSFVWVIKPFLAMVGDKVTDDAFLVVAHPEPRLDDRLFGILTLVTTAFGGIHCIGWLFDFPSHTERLLWRMSSIAITGYPLGVICGSLIFSILDGVGLGDENERLFDILLYLLSLLYIVSRALLLVVSLTTLRSLPSSAFQTVEWTTFLPHV